MSNSSTTTTILSFDSKKKEMNIVLTQLNFEKMVKLRMLSTLLHSSIFFGIFFVGIRCLSFVIKLLFFAKSTNQKKQLVYDLFHKSIFRWIFF